MVSIKRKIENVFKRLRIKTAIIVILIIILLLTSYLLGFAKGLDSLPSSQDYYHCLNER